MAAVSYAAPTAATAGAAGTAAGVVGGAAAGSMRYPGPMRRALVAVMLAASAATATGQPTRRPASPPAPAPPRPVAIHVDRTVGDFDAALLARGLRKHAAACRQRGVTGTVRLTLLLKDQPDRRGLRITAATGAAALRRCLDRRLQAATWPTGRLDAYAAFTATVRVAP